MKTVLDAADRSGKRTAAVREGHAQFWKTLEHATKNHRTNRERTFRRHADEPGQPIFLHTLLAHHVPGVNEDCGVRILRDFPDDIERGVIEIPAIRSVTMFVRIDMCPDLDAAQSELAHAAR